jgi:hypothetical protein
MTTALIAATAPLDPKVIESVLLGGDLSRLSAEQRIAYYNRVCESLGLNPLTQPFAYLRLNGKEILYAKKDATEQLRMRHGISIDPKSFTREVIEGVYVVTAPASTPEGRTDVSTGAVAIEGLKGENRANAMMKAETKAKRRVTLSICGLGMLDETEVETVQGATVVAETPVVEAAVVESPAGYEEWLLDYTAAADGGLDELRKAWQASKPEYRKFIDGATKEAIKAKAAAVRPAESTEAA